MRSIYALAFLPVLALGACAVPNGGSTPATQAAANLTQGAALLTLASGLYALSPAPNPAVELALNNGQVALSAAAGSLMQNGTPGNLAANVSTVDATLNAAVASMQAVNPVGAAKVAAYRTAFLAALHLYNADAVAAGLQVIPNIPAS